VNRAFFVAAGILVSRLAGLVRLRVFAHYFGLRTDAADAFNAAFRIPNLLQNLFGEGALSASFIPVYAVLVARGDQRTADRVAGAVGSLLALVVAVLVLAGMTAAPLLTAVIAPGFTGAKRDLTVAIVRVLFPGAGLLVLSAWCLGILNTHGRFFLSYAAPVVWNAAMITTLVVFGAQDLPRLAVLLAWGSVAGSALQFVVQLPVVLRVAPEIRIGLGFVGEHVRAVGTNFIPAAVSRGVVQVSAFVDALLASLLPTGAMTGLVNAQLIYTLPVSLFGMSIAAAELPAMSSEAALDESSREALRSRLDAGLQRIAFLVIPSAVGFLALGDVIAAAILQTGRFSSADALYVWAILAGSAIGLPASTMGRLYAASFYALRDTKTPLRYAVVRVTVATALAVPLAFWVPPMLGLTRLWGAAGITVASGCAAWVEMSMLRKRLNASIGRTGVKPVYAIRLCLAAVVAAALSWGVRAADISSSPVVAAVVVLGVFGLSYLGTAALLGVNIQAFRSRASARWDV